MLPKTRAYVKSYTGQKDDQTKWMYFLIEDDDLLEKHIILFRKKSVVILKRNSIANLFTIKYF